MRNPAAHSALGKRIGLAAMATVGLLEVPASCLDAREPSPVTGQGDAYGRIIWFDVQRGVVVLKTASPNTSAAVEEQPVNYFVGERADIVKEGPLELGDYAHVRYVAQRDRRVASSIIVTTPLHALARATEN